MFKNGGLGCEGQRSIRAMFGLLVDDEVGKLTTLLAVISRSGILRRGRGLRICFGGLGESFEILDLGEDGRRTGKTVGIGGMFSLSACSSSSSSSSSSSFCSFCCCCCC